MTTAVYVRVSTVGQNEAGPAQGNPTLAYE